MPGIFEDLGIVSNGKLTQSTYPGFIADVRKRLRTGQGIFRAPDLSNPTEPIPLYELAQIEKQFLFPEFHSIWRERYEKMVQQLNVPGGFGLAMPTFLIDPVALAKAMGMKELPEVKFPDIFFEIQGIPPPDGIPAPPPTIKDVIESPTGTKSLDFFNRYMKDLDPLDPAIPAKLMKIIQALPVPPVPVFPDPRLIGYGYTQRFNFENKVYNSHRATHGSMMGQAITLLPNTIIELASGAGCYSLMKATKETAKLTQPIPMSTSVFEIAAQEIFLQHQIKLESAIVLGQMLGSGAILTALATTPEETGGLGLINTSATQQSETAPGQQSSASNSSSASGGGSSSTTPSSSSPSASQSSTNQQQESDSFTSGQPVDDVPPPGAGVGEPSTDSYPSEYQQDQAQQSSGQPSGYGFGGPGEDVPPGGNEGQADLYPAKQGSGGSANPNQSEPFGFGAPPEDVPPPEGSSNQGGSGNATSQSFADEQQAPDVYPPQGGSQGQQTYPPGFGETPPDVGQEAQPYNPPAQSPEENLGELQGVSVPSSYEADTSPVQYKEVDIEDPNLVPPPNTASYSTPDDDDGENNDSIQNPAKSFTKNLSNVRKRIKDLIEGGGSCPAQNGFIGGILGPPPDWSAESGISQKTFRGNVKGTSAKEWANPIPGANPTFVIGAGYLGNLSNAKQTESNPVQKYTTNCTAMPGFIVTNLLYDPSDTNMAGKISVVFDSTSDSIVLKNGYPYTKSALQLPGEIDPSGGGLVAPPYVAAFLDAWVNADPGSSNINPQCPPADPLKIRPPKYGDIYITRDDDKYIRHIGVIVGWSQEENYVATADAGQGSMPNSQGMSYNKRPLSVDPTTRAWKTGGESAQGDAANKRIIMGWIDMDLFIGRLKSLPGAYDNRPKPSWLY